MAGQAIFGSGTGTSQAIHDINSSRMAQAEANIMNAKAEATHSSTMREQAFMQRMAQVEQGGQAATPDPLSYLKEVAAAQVQSGMVKEGLNTLKGLGQIQESQARAQKADAARQAEQLKFFGSLLNNVHDESTWQQAKALYAHTMGVQLSSGLANEPFSPDLVNGLRASTMTAYQRLMTADDRANTESKVQRRDLQNQITKLQIDNLKKGLPKNGAKHGSHVPSRIMMEYVDNAIGSIYDVADRVGDPEFETAALAVADDAQKLMNNNPALTTNEAIHRAVGMHQDVLSQYPMLRSTGDNTKPAKPTVPTDIVPMDVGSINPGDLTNTEVQGGQ